MIQQDFDSISYSIRLQQLEEKVDNLIKENKEQQERIKKLKRKEVDLENEIVRMRMKLSNI